MLTRSFDGFRAGESNGYILHEWPDPEVVLREPTFIP